MGFDSSGGQQFPMAAAIVWRHLCRVAPQLGSVKETDQFLKRIVIGTGVSAFSWGEDVAVAVEEVNPTACRVVVSSSSGALSGLAGTTKNPKNVNAVISALSASLQKEPRPVAPRGGKIPCPTGCEAFVRSGDRCPICGSRAPE